MIESDQNRVAKLVRSLVTSHTRRKQQLVLVEGPRAVTEMLLARATVKLAVVRGGESQGRSVVSARRALQQEGVPVHEAAPAVFDRLASADNAQGVLAVCQEPAWPRDRVLDPADPRPLAVLSALQDPGNLGTVLRTAAAFGFRGALLLPGTTDPYAVKVVRAAAGTLFRLPLVRGGDAEEEVAGLTRAGFQVVCAAAPGDSVQDATRSVKPPVALVVGNEGAGIPASVVRQAARTVWIPTEVESLNAAVAFGVLAYAFTR